MPAAARLTGIVLPTDRCRADKAADAAWVRRQRVASANSNLMEGDTVNMNKTEMIDYIAEKADISKAAAQRALDATVDSIQQALAKGGMVTLVGFGTFYVGDRAARTGRDPRTGNTIEIKAAKVPKFRAGKALKDALN